MSVVKSALTVNKPQRRQILVQACGTIAAILAAMCAKTCLHTQAEKEHLFHAELANDDARHFLGLAESLQIGNWRAFPERVAWVERESQKSRESTHESASYRRLAEIAHADHRRLALGLGIATAIFAFAALAIFLSDWAW